MTSKAELSAFNRTLTYIAEQSSPDLTVRQLLVLTKLAELSETKDHVGQGDIIDALGDLTQYKATVSRNIKVFFKEISPIKQGLGFIENTQNPWDSRKKLLQLTAKGKTFVKGLLKSLT